MAMIYADKTNDQKELVPRALLRAMAGLVVVVLGLTTFAVLSERPHEAPVHSAPVAHQMLIQIKDGPRGSASVANLEGQVLAESSEDARGFIAVVWNALKFERHRNGVDENPPVTLMRFEDGRIGLRDDATGWKIHLTGFGRDNTAAWAGILERGIGGTDGILETKD